jgi:hypothetical protein
MFIITVENLFYMSIEKGKKVFNIIKNNLFYRFGSYLWKTMSKYKEMKEA